MDRQKAITYKVGAEQSMFACLFCLQLEQNSSPAGVRRAGAFAPGVFCEHVVVLLAWHC